VDDRKALDKVDKDKKEKEDRKGDFEELKVGFLCLLIERVKVCKANFRKSKKWAKEREMRRMRGSGEN